MLLMKLLTCETLLKFEGVANIWYEIPDESIELHLSFKDQRVYRALDCFPGQCLR